MKNFFQRVINRYLWFSVRVGLGYFYNCPPKKRATGMEHIPKDCPVLFCLNHPNAFMDAIFVVTTMTKPSWFLARSDVFRKPLLAKFLRFIRIVPIYRLQEGIENLAKNDETFNACNQLLEKNQSIIIFSEGLCIQERRIRKLKKGTARIAFGAEEKNDFKLNLMIVPVGVNYTSTPWKFRKPAHVRFGEPFAMKDYEAAYKKSKPAAINQFTRDLEERMKKEVVVINDRENDELVAHLEEMFLAKWAEENYCDPRNQKETFTTSRQIAHIINVATQEEPERLNDLREQAKKYFSLLDKFKLRDWLLRPETISKMNTADVLADYFIFTLGFPFWLFGVITNYVPYKVPYNIAQKIVKNIEWHASINASIGIFAWQVYWLLQSLAVALIFRNWFVLAGFMIAVPLCGMFAQVYWVRMKKSKGKTRLLRAVRKEKNKVEEMMFLRMEIEKEMAELREKYK